MYKRLNDKESERTTASDTIGVASAALGIISVIEKECISGINSSNKYIMDDEFKEPRGISEPSTLWNWSNGTYTINGSSSSGQTLYSNYYFTNITSKKYNLTAGSASRLRVDLVHKGWILQTVVSTWTIEAGDSKNYTIKSSDLDGHSNSDNYYFRFNGDPLGSSYSVYGTFGT